MSIQVHSISHRFGPKPVLTEISFAVPDGEILCVIGASGSGKSTLLRIIAGLEPLQQGRLVLDDATISEPGRNPPPEQRPVGLVFQDHALFPHLNVADNVAFGLQDQHRDQRRRQVDEQLTSVGLADLAQRYPHTLSGGQQQRVALVRALATQPRVMLLDEPFASVDTPLRRQLREDARLRLKASGTATIMVTHDPEEAMAMADQILVLSEGRMVQSGSPHELWQTPAHPFVAESLGGMQSLQGQIAGDQIVTAFGNLPWKNLLNPPPQVEGESIVFGVRGSDIDLVTEADPSRSAPPLTVEDVRFDGQSWSALIRSGDDRLKVTLNNDQALTPAASVNLSFTHTQAVAYN